MDEYISREAVFQVVHGIARGIATKDTEAFIAKDMKAFYMAKGAKEILDSVDTNLCYIPAADVQPVKRGKGGLKMADLIERYKITANLPSVLMNYCNRFNSKQLESITEMIYELENSIESADVQPVVDTENMATVSKVTESPQIAIYKQLLKSATVIIKNVDCNDDYLCDECEYRTKCDGSFSFYWKRLNEASKLIGGDAP